MVVIYRVMEIIKLIKMIIVHQNQFVMILILNIIEF